MPSLPVDRPRHLRAAVLALLTPCLLLAACSSSDSSIASPAQPAPAAPSPSPTTPSPADAVRQENTLPGDPSWRTAVKRATDPTAISGYADKSAVDPGEPVRLFVSTTADRYTVTAYRMGWYGGDRARRIWRSAPQRGTVQDDAGYIAATRTHYAKWDPTTTLDTADWPPGMYLLRLAGDAGREWLVPLVVRSPDAEGRVVFLMADLTWQAYNEWGGRSSYTGPGAREDRSRAVSFSRPYANGSGAGKFLGYENPVVALAEKAGIPVSYVATSDLADGDDRPLAGAEGIVSLGHNEYWTVAEREAVTKARDGGTDLAFLGANTMYWRTRLEPGPQGMPLEVIHKDTDDPVDGPETTVRFRDEPNARPERSLVGMDYECYPATGRYTVTSRDFFLFDGLAPRAPLTDLVAVEVDRAYPLPGTPKSLQIVANSPTDCAGVPTVSTSTYYDTASGAGVFATGTMGWVLNGMRPGSPRDTRQFVRAVTSRLLERMLDGPLGERYPSRPNLDRFELGAQNTTGTVEPPLR